MKHRFLLAGLVLIMRAGGLNTPQAQADQIFLMPKSVTSVTNLDDGAIRYLTDIQLVKNNAYLSWSQGDLSHSGGLEILDVSNPARPVRVGGCDVGVEAIAIRVAGRYAYLVGGNYQHNTNAPGWLEIIDVLDPSRPVRVGGIQTPGRGLAVRLKGSLAYVAEDVRWTGTNLQGALEIFDVRNATNPVRLSTFNTGGAASCVEISGDYAYLADGVTDLAVLDVSNPVNPRQVGVFDTDEWRNHGGFEHGGAAVTIQVDGNLAYSAGEDGLHILDVTNPAVPVRIGGYNDLPFDDAFHLSGRWAYLSFWRSFQNAFSLLVYDVTNPSSPVRLAFADIQSSAIQVADPYVYVAGGSLLIYEIRREPAFRYVARTESSLLLIWNAPPGFKLQSTPSLTKPIWSDVPGLDDAAQVELQFNNGSEFFRLFRP